MNQEKPKVLKSNSELNIYIRFIEYLKTEEKLGLDLKKGIEKHHIIPKHTGYSDNALVSCFSANYTLAHFYRFLAYGEKRDWIAYSMRKNQKLNANELSLLVVEKNKKAKILFWDSDWQKTQGLKGGLLGGSKKSIKQYNARQRVGLKYGRQTGIQNQSARLQKQLSKETIWLYQIEKEDFYISISPQQSFSDIVNKLQAFSDEKNPKNLKKNK